MFSIILIGARLENMFTLSLPACTGIDFLAKYCIKISRRIFFRRSNSIAD